jgi:uncharacterized phage protein gp47/JayE
MSTPSWNDFYDLGVYTAQVRRPSLVVYQGDVTDAMIAGCATMASTIVGWGAGRFKIVFLDGATGADLTANCHDRGVDRDIGAHSVGVATISRLTHVAGAGTVPTGTRVATTVDASGKFVTFTTNIDTVFGATDDSKTVNCTCTVIDVVGNVAPGLINRILDLSSLWDQTLTVTNLLRFAAGAPEESDEDLRDRTRNFFLTQARGTIDALIYAAKLVPGVSRASIVVDESGVVSLYAADKDGNSNPAMVAAVTAKIEGPPAWRDAADVVDTIGATLYTVDIDLSLTVRTGVDVSTLLDTVRKAVVAQVNRGQPGDTLFRDVISSAGRAVDPEAIKSVRVNSPLADLVPDPDQAIATDISHVTFS